MAGSRVFADIHYITLPAAIAESAVPALADQMKRWVPLQVELHVLDFRATTQISDGFIAAVREFSQNLSKANVQLFSLNVSEPIAKKIKDAGAEKVFNRIRNLGQDLRGNRMEKMPVEKRPLLMKYLAEGVFKAVEVGLNSTVSCDQNYHVSPEKVPYNDFDVISYVQVFGEFLRADFRFLASYKVLDKLCRAMHGPGTEIETELLESMALDMLNMIYGHAKSHLNDKEGFHLPNTIPKLIRKVDFDKIERSGAEDLMIMPAVTPLGSFYVEVDFKTR